MFNIINGNSLLSNNLQIESQYKINFNTLRIAHTYGPGMQIVNDGRVMADFIGDALNKKIIP